MRLLRSLAAPGGARGRALALAVLGAWAASRGVLAQTNTALPQTQPLEVQEDLSARMVEGIDKYLLRLIDESVTDRARRWKRDFSSPAAYEKSIQPNRDRLWQILGAVDARVPMTALEFPGSGPVAPRVAETDQYVVYAVRWPVFPEVHGEGLLLDPKRPPVARLVVLPDADQTPEMLAGLAPGVAPESQTARRLAEQGCQVIVPVLIDRQDTWSGSPALKRFTNQPHREWVYRPAFELGRHVIGYEVQKVIALVEWFAQQPAPDTNAPARIGLSGYGEGGLIALHAAALDNRIQACLVSGYFNARQRVWEEPIYRNVFGLLEEFGDAELAGMITPRSLIVEHSEVPKVGGPPPARDGRSGAAPGVLATPERATVEAEVERARKFFPGQFPARIGFVVGNEGLPVGPGCDMALTGLLQALGVTNAVVPPAPTPPADSRAGFDPRERQHRQVTELVEHTQRLLNAAERVREAAFWGKLDANPTNDWAAAVKEQRRRFWDTVIGRLPPASATPNARSRKVVEKPKWTGYDVVLDVWPGVFAWGQLLVPKDLRPGERRPVVVCQHGLEGLPEDTYGGPGDSGFEYYKGFAGRLADRGFVIFAPHNPYRGGDRFRALQRKANALGKSLFSVIAAQHERILDWLADQPFVDPKRIGFYGLSYGGKTAMRVPALLDRYAVSICSADFNEWIWKNASLDSPYSYLYTGEWEMPEFNLGNTFNYAEMAALIAPRPFMVERGHDDGVAPDEWVAYEYAKVRRLYNRIGYPERTAIEFFDGPHTINGVGTFQFLYRHLDWSRR